MRRIHDATWFRVAKVWSTTGARRRPLPSSAAPHLSGVACGRRSIARRQSCERLTRLTSSSSGRAVARPSWSARSRGRGLRPSHPARGAVVAAIPRSLRRLQQVQGATAATALRECRHTAPCVGQRHTAQQAPTWGRASADWEECIGQTVDESGQRRRSGSNPANSQPPRSHRIPSRYGCRLVGSVVRRIAPQESPMKGPDQSKMKDVIREGSGTTTCCNRPPPYTGTGRSNSGLKNRLARAAKMIGVKPTTAA